MSRTWWPLSISSRAIERPTAPAPAMATLMSAFLRTLVEDGVRVRRALFADDQVQHVALLDDGLAGGQHALAQAVDPRDPAAGLLLEVDGALADPGLGDLDVVHA